MMALVDILYYFSAIVMWSWCSMHGDKLWFITVIYVINKYVINE